MEKFISIICEYNPFHTGHEYQINKIREIFGDNSVILCVMSGHFVQRGDVSVFDKFRRAEAAVKCGTNLVLEMPFPFSMSSAEYFAEAGVYISNCVGADTLVFGSECGDIEKLAEAAEVTSGDEFKRLLTDTKDAGIVKARAKIFSEVTGSDSSVTVNSNDILGVEYIKAINKICRGKIVPYAIKREEIAYNDERSGMKFMSATGLRRMISENKYDEIKKYIPEAAYKIFSSEIDHNSAPALMKNIEGAIISFFRLADPKSLNKIAEVSGGLQYRLIEAAKNSSDLESFLKSAGTKKYTNARIRRAVFFSMFGVTEHMLKERPAYAQVLAADAAGREKLRRIKKAGNIEILTKPSDYVKLSKTAKEQYELLLKTDSLYTLSFPFPKEADIFLKKSPFIENLS